MTQGHYTPETFTARNAVGYLLRCTLNLMQPRLEALFANREFTFVQWCVLMQLRDGLANRAADISRNLNHDSGALTRVVDQLEARGLLERTRSTEDRRMVELALTQEGRRSVEASIPLVVDHINAILSDFSSEEIEMLVGMLKRIIDKLQDGDRGSAP
ncbi:MarR family transcriptional regulator [Emcibacter sp. SYSU 3D8]|uniref:MarR family winged helix-turn-helix transcriptional regulator n=1 Tax=Emcibacter sp. SYSU 3D8 TaxID=3133969 RepID=UPI0031FE85F2